MELTINSYYVTSQQSKSDFDENQNDLYIERILALSFFSFFFSTFETEGIGG